MLAFQHFRLGLSDSAHIPYSLYLTYIKTFSFVSRQLASGIRFRPPLPGQSNRHSWRWRCSLVSLVALFDPLMFYYLDRRISSHFWHNCMRWGCLCTPSDIHGQAGYLVGIGYTCLHFVLTLGIFVLVVNIIRS